PDRLRVGRTREGTGRPARLLTMRQRRGRLPHRGKLTLVNEGQGPHKGVIHHVVRDLSAASGRPREPTGSCLANSYRQTGVSDERPERSYRDVGRRSRETAA